MEKATFLHEDLPNEELPECLHGLEWPATKDDAIVHAAEHGALNEVLEFMEHLPDAVFTSEAGLRHAFTALETVDLSDLVTARDEEEEAEDGLSG